MPTEITLINEEAARISTFRIKGEMLLADARLVGRIALSHKAKTGYGVRIDLADVDLIDSEAASYLRGLEQDKEITLIGAEIFLQRIIRSIEGS